jgi:predicted PurR-regulated permease PerM
MSREPSLVRLKDTPKDAAKEAPAESSLTSEAAGFSFSALWQAAAPIATTGTFFILFIVALYLARSILMPVAAALMIGIMLSPISERAAQYSIPRALTAIALVVLFIVLVALLITLFAVPLTDWIARGPEIGALVKQKLQVFSGPLAAWQDVKTAITEAAGKSGPTVSVETSDAGFVQKVLAVATPAAGELLLFVGTLLFFLAGNNKLRRQLVVSFVSRGARLKVLRIWNDIEESLIGYLSTVTVINLGLGVVTGILTYLCGLPNAIMWGVLAFILNYIPYLGPAIMVVVLFAVGLISLPTLGQAVLTPALFVAITTVEGHFLTPSIIGRRLTLNPLVVFLALGFWTWLWGPLGAFLATPLLIVSLVALGHILPREEVALPG